MLAETDAERRWLTLNVSDAGKEGLFENVTWFYMCTSSSVQSIDGWKSILRLVVRRIKGCERANIVCCTSKAR